MWLWTPRLVEICRLWYQHQHKTGHVCFDGVGYPSHAESLTPKFYKSWDTSPPNSDKILVQQTRRKHGVTMTHIHFTPSTMQDPVHPSLNCTKTTQPQRSTIQQPHGPFDLPKCKQSNPTLQKHRPPQTGPD